MDSMIAISPTPLPGLQVADCRRLGDQRGSFARWFCRHSLSTILGSRGIRQSNHSRTTTVGAVRGLHFQHAPHAEMKLIRCIRGRVWDVLVDLRLDSPSFLRWHAEELSGDSDRMLIVPEGFAHGFQVLEPESEMLYMHTADYLSAAEGGVRWDDPRVGIPWPLPVTDLSARDRNHPYLDAGFAGLSP